MILRIIEECEVFDEEEIESFDIDGTELEIKNPRVVEYQVKSQDLPSALEEYEKFNPKKIVSCEDYFDGECESSKIRVAYFVDE